MSDFIKIDLYDVHAVVPAESLAQMIEAVSHVKGVVFAVRIHSDEGKVPVCRSRGNKDGS